MHSTWYETTHLQHHSVRYVGCSELASLRKFGVRWMIEKEWSSGSSLDSSAAAQSAASSAYKGCSESSEGSGVERSAARSADAQLTIQHIVRACGIWCALVALRSGCGEAPTSCFRVDCTMYRVSWLHR